MLPEDKIRIQHILDEIEDILLFVKDLSFQDFRNDKKTVNAVIRSIEIIGEAANRITPNLKVENPDIPWKEIIGMRNHLIHVYFDVDFETVWQTIQEDIPQLKKLFSAL